VRQLDERFFLSVRVGLASDFAGSRLEHAPIDWTDATFPLLAELEIEQPGSPAQCDELVA